MPSGTDLEKAEQFSACEMKEHGVTVEIVVDRCPQNLPPDAWYSFEAVILWPLLGIILGFIAWGLKKLWCWVLCRKRCQPAVKAIAIHHEAYLTQMSRKDIKVQKASWMKSLMKAKSEKEFQELKRLYHDSFCLADELAGKYSF